MRKHGLPLRRILLTLLVGAAILTGTSGLASAEPAGQVIALRGTATLERSGSRSALAGGVELSMGDWISTDPGARVKVRFADGSLVHLGENTRLRIDLAKFNPDEGTRNILLEMPLGLLRAAAAKSKTAGSSFEIHTGIGYSAVRGTEWFMAAAIEETRIYVQEGRVSVGTDFPSDQFPKLVEGGRWVLVSRKAGIAPIEDSPPGSLDSLIEQTEASAGNGATGTSVADAAETPNEIGTDTATDANASAVGPGTSTGSTDASGTSTGTGTGPSSADDAASDSSSNNSPSNSPNGGSSNGGSSNGGSSNGGSSNGGSSNGGSSSGGGSSSSGSSSGGNGGLKGNGGGGLGSGKSGPGKFK